MLHSVSSSTSTWVANNSHWNRPKKKMKSSDMINHCAAFIWLITVPGLDSKCGIWMGPGTAAQCSLQSFKGSPAALQNSRNRLNLMLMSSDAMWVTFRRDQMELVLKEKQKQRVVLFCAPLAEDHIQIQTQDHSCCSGVTVPKQSMLYTNGATGSQQLSCA